MIKRELFSAEHEAFRDTVRRFIEKEIAPYHAQWEADGVVPRELWRKAGAAGMLCCTIPEEYGGIGADYLFDVVVFEEMARSGFTGPGFLIHCDLVATYIKSFGTEAQKRAVAAEDGLGRGDRLARHDRAACRLRPEGHPHEGRARRRRLRHLGPEGLHLQRPAVRRDRAGHQDRQLGRRQGRDAVPRRYQPAGIPARQEPAQARHEGAGHLGAVLRRGARAGHRRCWARKARASS